MPMQTPDARQRCAALFDIATVIPVIRIDEVAHAVPLARALVDGGLRLLEITLRTPVAEAAARLIIEQVPDAIVGIGTVLTPGDLTRAKALGARFALSPGATPDLLDAAAATGLPFVPGVGTASEIMQALARGFDILKFFPAAAGGGRAALKAFEGPFPTVRFCPTGGIGEDSMADWLALSNVAAIGGSWLSPADHLRAGDWTGITDLARRAVARAKA